MEQVYLAYVTAGSKSEAVAIGNELVEHGLAACVNIIDNMNSIYIWDGELQYDNEVVLIAKTTEARLPELMESIKSNHSYDCPCILTLPVSGGNPAFLEWVAGQVKKP